MKFYKKIYQYFLCFLFLSSYTGCFDVKVLLKKIEPLKDTESSFVIRSSEGFIISPYPTLSYGYEIDQKSIEVSYKDKIYLNGNPSEYKVSYITPKLSENIKNKLQDYVYEWVDKNFNDIKDCSLHLSIFFEEFLQKTSLKNTDFKDLILQIDAIIDVFLQDTIEDILDPIVSYEICRGYADTYFKDKIVSAFLKELAKKNVSKRDKKQLIAHKNYRDKFFFCIVQSVIKDLLYNFLIAMPRSVIAQLINHEVDCLQYDGNNYLGSFVLLEEKGYLYFINTLDIDDYLVSVVHHESWPGWPLEVNKLMAIVCRTYLVWQVLQAQKSKRPYHIETGIKHQLYRGHHKYERLRKAISETKDVCIAYQGNPILAMFDSCCGGIIPAKIDDPGYKDHPYLLRQKECTYCKGCRAASWQADISYTKMLEAIKKLYPNVENIEHMYVTKKDPAGRVKKVMVQTSSSSFIMPGKKIYSLFPEVKSFCFDIQVLSKEQNYSKKQDKNLKKKNSVAVSKWQKKQPVNLLDKRFIVDGIGYGHHIGLCQWGAMKLIKDYHWNVSNVLQFYYPGTTLIKLTYVA